MYYNGGKGSKGNQHFEDQKYKHQKVTSGKIGQYIEVKLELKLIAEVGLVGYPNAGKSTLLKTLTNANPKIANYPFTTLYPNLGILKKYDQEIIIADIPGIIDGASQGIGLGNEFLRHISRTNTLVFLIEPNTNDISDTITTFIHLKNEINTYSKEILTDKNYIIALNKIDILNHDDIKKIKQTFKNINEDISTISCITTSGMNELTQRIFNHVKTTNHN